LKGYHLLRGDLTAYSGNEPAWREGERRFIWTGRIATCVRGYHFCSTPYEAYTFSDSENARMTFGEYRFVTDESVTRVSDGFDLFDVAKRAARMKRLEAVLTVAESREAMATAIVDVLRTLGHPMASKVADAVEPITDGGGYVNLPYLDQPGALDSTVGHMLSSRLTSWASGRSRPLFGGHVDNGPRREKTLIDRATFLSVAYGRSISLYSRGRPSVERHDAAVAAFNAAFERAVSRAIGPNVG